MEKSGRTVLIHELWNIIARTSGLSERVIFVIRNDEWIKIVYKAFSLVFSVYYLYAYGNSSFSYAGETFSIMKFNEPYNWNNKFFSEYLLSNLKAILKFINNFVNLVWKLKTDTHRAHRLGILLMNSYSLRSWRSCKEGEKSRNSERSSEKTGERQGKSLFSPQFFRSNA